MATSACTGTDDRVEYFFIVTAQLEGAKHVTISNTIQVALRDSRAKVYQVIREYATRQMGYGGFTILFFYLEPNRL
ncbi:hypothetical protein ABT298_36240 [Streptomyces sp. NPDC001034]|uniref:hypothetical protein n=1 Tax=Streptomyces sp. NPDC001034 TaxID=3154375 RepID=UPI003329FA6E